MKGQRTLPRGAAPGRKIKSSQKNIQQNMPAKIQENGKLFRGLIVVLTEMLEEISFFFSSLFSSILSQNFATFEVS